MISNLTHNIPRTLIPVLTVVAVLSLGSCGSDNLRGRLVLSGSSTLSPLAVRAVGQWKNAHPTVETSIENIGSDAGLERLVRYNDADLAMLSRPLTEADRSAALSTGKELFVLPVAWDAVCLVVPVSNTWAKSLSSAQTARAFTTAALWSDLDPSWPAEPIHRFVLGPDSGTADVFAESVLGGHKAGFYEASSAQSSEDDKILARGVAQVDGAIGFLGWTTVNEMDKGIRVLAFDNVTPTVKTIQDRSYGLPRKLWLVGIRQSLNPASKSFIRYLYDHYPSLTEGTGLVPLADNERQDVEATLKTVF